MHGFSILYLLILRMPCQVPDPRPGRCSQDSQKLPESSLRFIQDHSIMDKAVPAYFGSSPLFIRANIEWVLNERYLPFKLLVSSKSIENIQWHHTGSLQPSCVVLADTPPRFMLARNPMSPVRDPIQDKINIYFVFRYHSHFLYGLVSIGIEGKKQIFSKRQKISSFWWKLII